MPDRKPLLLAPWQAAHFASLPVGGEGAVRVPVKGAPRNGTPERCSPESISWDWVTPARVYGGGDFRLPRRLHGTAHSPFGAPGTVLWGRETWASGVSGCEHQRGVSYRADHIDPRGDGPAHPMTWRPSTNMPKWAARIWLRVLDVRVERVQRYSDFSALVDEGHPPVGVLGHAMDAWDARWAAKGYPWADNPHTWVARVRKEVPGE